MQAQTTREINTSTSENWCFTETSFDPEKAAYYESLFSIGNGYIGVRAYFDEGYATSIDNTISSTFLNGVYESLPVHYDEGGYGFAKNCDRIVDVPRLEILIELDGKKFDFNQGEVVNFRRELNFRDGIYSREVVWHSPNGKQLYLCFERVALQENKHILATRIQLQALNFSGEVLVKVCLNAQTKNSIESEDPREGGSISDKYWQLQKYSLEKDFSQYIHQTKNSQIQVVSSLHSKSSTNDQHTKAISEDRKLISHTHKLNLKRMNKQDVTAIVSYVDSRFDHRKIKLSEHGASLCKDYAKQSFFDLVEKQKKLLNDFWQTADVQITSQDNAQFATRFSLFHLLQSTGTDGRSSIAAKGLSGAGYDGHYFWDSEIYVFPFWLFSDPKRAKSLLEYRISILEEARQRAREMGHSQGALYAWRTIGGHESSSFFPAGTAQFHINADIAYAARSYIKITQDYAVLKQGMAEMIFETARIWLSIGHFNQRKAGQFCIHEVTGPDEYTAMVDNNYYTNKLAQAHLYFALELIEIISREDAVYLKNLLHKIGVDQVEISKWRLAAELMYLPFDQELGIYEQNEGFLEKPLWDFGNTPKNKKPLLLHYHYLTIYRHQVIKQADTVLALILEGQSVSLDVKRRSYEYYEKLTTHDSTLSMCVHGVLACEVGLHEQAYEYISDTLHLDLENKHHNTHYGVHTAAMGGVWMGAIQGFAGLRYEQGSLVFKPHLPKAWTKLAFKLNYKNCLVGVKIDKEKVVYSYLEGSEPIEITHFEKHLSLSSNNTEVLVKCVA